MQSNTGNNKRLDSYSILIVSKYFKTSQDFVNLMCVCKKFKKTTKKLRYNPISIKSLKLFPKIETQYLYESDDTKLKYKIYEIWKKLVYEIWHEVDYEQYLKQKRKTKYRYIVYTRENRINCNAESIPKKVNILGNNFFSIFEIDDGCNGYNNIKNITLEPNISCIKERCFENCTNLETADIQHVNFIGCFCFNGCISLKSIILSPFLLKLNYNTFFCCKSLTSIDFLNDKTVESIIKEIGDSACEKCENLLSFKIPNTVDYLGKQCFKYCSKLTSVTLSTSIKNLEKETFKQCISLNDINLPPGLISVGDECFSYCMSITKVEFPTTLQLTGKESFSHCATLSTINIPNSVTNIGTNWIKECPLLTTIELQNNNNNSNLKMSYSDSEFLK